MRVHKCPFAYMSVFPMVDLRNNRVFRNLPQAVFSKPALGFPIIKHNQTNLNIDHHYITQPHNPQFIHTSASTSIQARTPSPFARNCMPKSCRRVVWARSGPQSSSMLLKFCEGSCDAGRRWRPWPSWPIIQ